MVATWVQLANKALDKVGAKRITSFSEDSKAARVTQEAYPDIVDEVLTEHAWATAMERQALAELSSDNLTTWEYKYQLPVSPWCLRPDAVVDEDYGEPDPKYPFVVEGRVLYCNVENAILKYVARPDSPASLGPMLVNAIACRLAQEICYSLTQSVDLTDRMKAAYETALYRAKWENSTVASESTSEEDATATEWVDAGNS